jgi:hypothetical protein
MTQNRVLSTLSNSSIAGKNKVINGDFNLWSLGTTFNSIANFAYAADRVRISYDGSGTHNVTQQTFTPGTAPVAGYEGKYFMRFTQATAGSGATYNRFTMNLDDVRTLAGQTATVSFWAKAGSNQTITSTVAQNYGTGGGSPVEVETSVGTFALTTSWQRFTGTVAIPSITGKTIGTNHLFMVYFKMPLNVAESYDFWGIQLEAGSTATAFSTSGSNSQLETAAVGSTSFDGVLVSTNAFNNGSYSGTNGWAGYQVAGKNKIINGDMAIWQRGTSFSSVGGYGSYSTADRFCVSTIGATSSGSRQAFTAGTAPVPGYESNYYMRITMPSSGATFFDIGQRVEDVRTFSGQVVTISYWAKASAAGTIVKQQVIQSFGSGGSSQTYTDGATVTLTTSWQRYTSTVTVPSVANTTIGAGSWVGAYMTYVSGTINSAVIDTWGWQLEAGSVATSFTTATNNPQGELSACQRYYWRNSATSTYTPVAYGFATSSTNAAATIFFPVTMRTNPSSIDFSSLQANDTQAGYVVSAATFSGTEIGTQSATVNFTTASGLTQYRPAKILSNGSTSGYLGFSAEL